MEEFLTWTITETELTRAVEQARQLSAYVLEDEAVQAGREIAKQPGTAQRVSAYKAAMDQLRWSAERRNSTAFGNKGVTGGAVIPIKIVTNLNLGQATGPVNGGTLDIYKASVPLLENQVVDTTVEEIVEAKALPTGLKSASQLLLERETLAAKGEAQDVK